VVDSLVLSDEMLEEIINADSDEELMRIEENIKATIQEMNNE
jgi:hypothetical protein